MTPKTVAPLFACLALLLASSPAGGAGPQDLDGARVGLRDAIAAALAAQPGQAVEADLESGGGSVVFEVEIVTGDGLHEVTVDAASGAVLGTEREMGRRDQRELTSHRKALAQARMSLAELVERGESVVKGPAIAAELESEDGVEADVLFLNDGLLVEVGLDAVDGRVTEIEIEDDGEDGDEDEDDDGDEDDGEDEDDNHDAPRLRR